MNYEPITDVSKDVKRIADSLERIATILESNVHISIDHGHIEHIDHVDHTHIDSGDINTHAKTW
tara:strand:+ start:140 stop:331 length:192 start_codon:yes stop_codon:yes gene_type:complete